MVATYHPTLADMEHRFRLAIPFTPDEDYQEVARDAKCENCGKRGMQAYGWKGQSTHWVFYCRRCGAASEI